MPHEQMIASLEKIVGSISTLEQIPYSEKKLRAHILLANLYADNSDARNSRVNFDYAEYLYESFLRPNYDNVHSQAIEFGVPEENIESFCEFAMEKYKKNYWQYIITAAKLIRLEKK